MGLRTIMGLGVMAGMLLPAAGCASLREGGGQESGRAGVSFEGGAVILSGPALEDGPGTVLAAMTGKVPNFRVRRPLGQCPEISLRNYATFESQQNPHVYVDGTRSTDTCILETLRTDDVERVEVYAQGFTTRPGYGTHGPGLILVFMRGAGSH